MFPWGLARHCTSRPSRRIVPHAPRKPRLPYCNEYATRRRDPCAAAERCSVASSLGELRTAHRDKKHLGRRALYAAPRSRTPSSAARATPGMLRRPHHPRLLLGPDAIALLKRRRHPPPPLEYCISIYNVHTDAVVRREPQTLDNSATPWPEQRRSSTSTSTRRRRPGIKTPEGRADHRAVLPRSSAFFSTSFGIPARRDRALHPLSAPRDRDLLRVRAPWPWAVITRIKRLSQKNLSKGVQRVAVGQRRRAHLSSIEHGPWCN